MGTVDLLFERMVDGLVSLLVMSKHYLFIILECIIRGREELRTADDGCRH